MKKVIHLFTVSMSIRFLEGLSNPLRNAGYELIVICSDGPEARDGEKKGEFRFYPVEMARGLNPIENIRAWIQVRKIFKKEKPDIVHGNTPIGGLIAMSVAWVLGIKNRVYTLHGLKYTSEKGLKKQIIRLFEKMAIGLSKKAFAVSNGLREFAINERLVKPNKLSVLNYGSVKGIDLQYANKIRENGRLYYEEKFQLKHDRMKIGYFGRITEEKGIPEFIKTVKSLTDKMFSFDVIICGPNELSLPCNKKDFDFLIKEQNVSYFGMVDNPLEYMVCCDVIILPTHREGFGLVNIEANSVGVPVITTKVMGCIDSIEENVTGLFFDVGDVDDLCKKTEYLLSNKECREKMGKYGIARVESKFNRTDIWNELIRHYDGLF